MPDKATVEMVKQDAFVGDHTPQINAPGDGTAVGIYQEELGLVKGKAYVGYLYVAADGKVAPVTVSLSWGQGDADKAVHTIKSVGAKYTKVAFKFTAGADSDNGRLAITTSRQGQAEDRLRVPDARRQRRGFPQGHARTAPAAQRPGVSVAGRQLRERL